MTQDLPPYTSTIHYERRLCKYDIVGSMAHVKMLARQRIVSQEDVDSILDGLHAIQEEIEQGVFPWREGLEDIHMNIEARLFDKIGDAAGRLHTARSRNDQIVTDVRLHAKDVINETLTRIGRLQEALLDQADANRTTVLPGYTHLQRAQPVLLAHHHLAYFEMLERDKERFKQAYHRADVLPLGSGALAGVPYPIDREFVASELGFSRISRNSMDAVADRDYLLDFHSAAAICMMHLSRLAEELILWSSEEFRFIRLADQYTTGSSIMPQKRNPDFAELARGKTGRVYGHLMGLLTLMKGLPLTYNRDMQDDKEGFFDTVDTLLPTLDAFAGMVSTMTVNADRMREATEEGGYLLATDIADYLVSRGTPFREAHGISQRLSRYAHAEGKTFDELTIEEYKTFSNKFDKDVLSITVDSSVAARDVPGGTAPSRVEQALAEAKRLLEADDAP